MTVFPLVRSVGLRAATVSSRAATVPMFGRTRPSADSLRDLSQLGAVGHDNEVDRQSVGGPCLRRPGYGHQRSSGSEQTRGPPLDVATDDIEDQIDSADVFQGVVVEVDELVRAEVECGRPAAGTSGADDVSAGLTGELHRHRAGRTGRAVHQDALPRQEVAVIEQTLPGGQASHRYASAPHQSSPAPVPA